MNELPVPPELWALVELAFDYGFHALPKGAEPLHPVVVSENAAGERTLAPTLVTTPADPFEFALRALREDADAVRAAILIDGYTHFDGATEDALLVVVGSRDDAVAHRFAQRYRKSRLRRTAQKVGNLAYVGEEESVLFGDRPAGDSSLPPE